MLGWYIFVKNLILEVHMDNFQENSILKIPPSYGEFIGPPISANQCRGSFSFNYIL